MTVGSGVTEGSGVTDGSGAAVGSGVAVGSDSAVGSGTAVGSAGTDGSASVSPSELSVLSAADGDEVRLRFTLYSGADLGVGDNGEVWGDW